MLILCNDYKHLLGYPEGEVIEGQFVTVNKDRGVRPVRPGDIVRGVAGDTSAGVMRQADFESLVSGRMTVYYEGEMMTNLFEPGEYEMLQDIYVSPEGRICQTGPDSAKVGICTQLPGPVDSGVPGVEDGQASLGTVIGFRFIRGAVVPPKDAKDRLVVVYWDEEMKRTRREFEHSLKV